MERRKQIDVVVIEDSIDDRELTEFAMMQADDGIQVLHFKDGVDALNFIFGKKRYEGHEIQSRLKLVVLDLGLPTIDGLEVLRKIRSEKETKMLPVVILTSSKEQHDVSVAYELGANSYVVKPNGFDGYVKKIGSLAFYWSKVNERPN